jgi:hypothetical protein
VKGKLNQTLKLDLDEAIGISFLIHINQALPISFLEVDNNHVAQEVSGRGRNACLGMLYLKKET